MKYVDISWIGSPENSILHKLVLADADIPVVSHYTDVLIVEKREKTASGLEKISAKYKSISTMGKG